MRSMSRHSDEVTIVAWSEDDAPPARGLARPAQRRSVIRRITRGVLLGVTLASVAVCVIAPIWLWKTGRLQSMGETLRDHFVSESATYGMAVDQVLLIGRALAPKDALARAIDVDRGTPILSFDPDEMRRRLETVPWVRAATVARRLPDTVIVRLQEYVPFALWQRDGRFALVDRDGTVILDDRQSAYGREAIARFSNLPVVVGDGAPAMAAPLLDALAGYPEVAVRMQAAVRVSDRRWDLTLTPGVRVALPENDWRAALARLAAMHADQRLLDRAVSAIDLRLPDRVVLMPAEPAGDGRGRKDGRA